MKYLSTQLSGADLTRVYRAFAKLLHPDASGGNEDAFKTLQSEYELCNTDAGKANTFDITNIKVAVYQNMRMPFGKHKGKLIAEMPPASCQWYLDNIDTLSWLLREALIWRVQNG